MKIWLALLFTFVVGMGAGYAIWYNTSPCTLDFNLPQAEPTQGNRMESTFL